VYRRVDRRIKVEKEFFRDHIWGAVRQQWGIDTQLFPDHESGLSDISIESIETTDFFPTQEYVSDSMLSSHHKNIFSTFYMVTGLRIGRVVRRNIINGEVLAALNVVMGVSLRKITQKWGNNVLSEFTTGAFL
jgi:hypothetical protein